MDAFRNALSPERRETAQDALLRRLIATATDLQDRGIAVPAAFDELIARAVVRKLREAGPSGP